MATFTLIVTMLLTAPYGYPTYTVVTIPGYSSQTACWKAADQFKGTHKGLGKFKFFACQRVD